MKRVSLVVLLFVTVLLTSCAPGASGSSAPPVQVQQFGGEVSFYPKEAGASWTYLGQGETLDASPFVMTVVGPTVIDGDLWVVTSGIGKGLELVWFRQYRPDGVFLLREQRPGTEINYDPPLQEMPAESALRVGATWGGETTATVVYPEAKDAKDQTFIQKFNYTYTVVDERKNLNTNAGDFDAFVIDFVARIYDESGNELPCDGTGECKQTIFFSPNVGEIKTENDYFLVDTNVR
jgi:hypothetical protein